MFSPHTRGCSALTVKPAALVPVFPAYAGMFRLILCFLGHQGRFPRIRGDVPYERYSIAGSVAFSPHTRGCSPQSAAWQGVILGFPRIRGDVPLVIKCLYLLIRFSPHTRGCSGGAKAAPAGTLVFPAYAGMFLTAPPSTAVFSRFPRIRGDVPVAEPRETPKGLFSPHTRGCSGSNFLHRPKINVFPAYAGMFRRI